MKIPVSISNLVCGKLQEIEKCKNHNTSKNRCAQIRCRKTAHLTFYIGIFGIFFVCSYIHTNTLVPSITKDGNTHCVLRKSKKQPEYKPKRLIAELFVNTISNFKPFNHKLFRHR